MVHSMLDRPPMPPDIWGPKKNVQKWENLLIDKEMAIFVLEGFWRGWVPGCRGRWGEVTHPIVGVSHPYHM